MPSIDEMKKIAEARTEYQSWKDFYNDCTEENAKFAEMAANNWDKLIKVVEAAKEYYTLEFEEGQQDMPEWQDLHQALKALEQE